MAQTLERSTGIAVGGYIVGGGYEGITKELDNLVEKEAGILQRLFGKDVEIRFNSNRESGGAWLINSLKGFDGNCQVGLSAGIRNGKIYIETYVDVSALANPKLATEHYNTKCDVYHENLLYAEHWLLYNIDKDKIAD